MDVQILLRKQITNTQDELFHYRILVENYKFNLLRINKIGTALFLRALWAFFIIERRLTRNDETVYYSVSMFIC